MHKPFSICAECIASSRPHLAARNELKSQMKFYVRISIGGALFLGKLKTSFVWIGVLYGNIIPSVSKLNMMPLISTRVMLWFEF